MKKSFVFWQVVGFVFVSVAGTLLHFLYDWTNQSTFAGLFSAVNESIWEHMKLLFVPMIVFAVAERFLLKKGIENFWCLKLFGILAGLSVIPTLYYTYTGIFGVSVDWFNITIFFIAALIGFLVECVIFKKQLKCRLSNFIALTVICFIGLAFLVFTFSPPEIPLFQDPLTKTFGIQ